MGKQQNDWQDAAYVLKLFADQKKKERKKRQVNYACKKVFDDVVDRDFFSERLGLIIQQSQTQCFAWALIRSIVR